MIDKIRDPVVNLSLSSRVVYWRTMGTREKETYTTHTSLGDTYTYVKQKKKRRSYLLMFFLSVFFSLQICCSLPSLLLSSASSTCPEEGHTHMMEEEDKVDKGAKLPFTQLARRRSEDKE